MIPDLNWPLMQDNIRRDDVTKIIEFLQADPLPKLTQSYQVKEFEHEWSEWLGVKHSVFVSSGAAANLITLSALSEMVGGGEIIVPPLAWVSDITSVIYAGFTPVFVDINPWTLACDVDDIERKISSKTRAIFLTHVLGYNGLDEQLLNLVTDKGIYLIEDACESHGATYKDKKVGSYGDISNFSFYYAHHMSTIEGGMVCTNDRHIDNLLRMIRGHGMAREGDSNTSNFYVEQNRDLSKDFIFAVPGYNVRSTEINAVLGRSQLKTLDANNGIRKKNAAIFYSNLDTRYFRTEMAIDGSCSYAFTPILRYKDDHFRDKIEELFRDCRVEYRRGLSGGGNQLRQPYIRKYIMNRYGAQSRQEFDVILGRDFPQVEHVHKYGWYIGNYPSLETEKIRVLCDLMNKIGKVYGHV